MQSLEARRKWRAEGGVKEGGEQGGPKVKGWAVPQATSNCRTASCSPSHPAPAVRTHQTTPLTYKQGAGRGANVCAITRRRTRRPRDHEAPARRVRRGAARPGAIGTLHQQSAARLDAIPPARCGERAARRHPSEAPSQELASGAGRLTQRSACRRPGTDTNAPPSPARPCALSVLMPGGMAACAVSAV